MRMSKRTSPSHGTASGLYRPEFYKKQPNQRKVSASIIILVLTVIQILTYTQLIYGGNVTERGAINGAGSDLFTGEPAPRQSDVSGKEFYAEQIGATIIGNKSIISQSYITNDTNIFSMMDFSDPAFESCSFVISLSNGQTLPTFPAPITSNVGEGLQFSYDIPRGFIYYDNSTDVDVARIKKERAIDILKNTFNFDIIITGVIEDEGFGYLYNFISAPLNAEIWQNYINATLSNAPSDGYWKAFNYSYLLGEDYLSSHYLSSTIVYSSSFENIRNGIGNVTFGDIQSSFDLSVLDTMEQFSALNGMDLGNASASLGLGDLSSIDLGELAQGLDTYLQNVVIFSIQFEGNPSAITELAESDSYGFDLFRALYYGGSELSVTSKAFNSIMGIFMSGITVSMFSATPISIMPSILYLDDYNLKRIEDLLFLMGSDLDISSLSDYSFKYAWRSQESSIYMLTIPQNLNDDKDPINLLDFLGVGFPILPGAILEPLEDFSINYTIIEKEPSLKISKVISNGSRMLESVPIMNVSVINNGDTDVWGTQISTDDLSLLVYLLSNGQLDITISNDPRESLTLLNMIYGGTAIEDLFNAIEDQGYNISEYFHDDDPRIFMVDTYGTGMYDYYYPEFNMTNLYTFAPYSPRFQEEVLSNPDVIGGLPLNLQLVAASLVAMNIFNYSGSIFNPANWVLHPGEGFSYNRSASTSTLRERYSLYDDALFHIYEKEGISPVLSYGSEAEGTDVINSFKKNDGWTWDLESERFQDRDKLQYYLLFKNTSVIPGISDDKFTPDAINFEFLFQTTSNISTSEITFEILNYSAADGGEFVNLSPVPFANSTNITTGIINITLSNLDYNLSDFVDMDNDFSILIRMGIEHSVSFSMAYDYIGVSFLNRENDMVYQLPASVLYQNERGNIQYSMNSNSLAIGSWDSSSVMARASLNITQTYCGDIVHYSLQIENIGNLAAENITVRIQQPGILKDIRNISVYTLNNKTRMNATAGNFTINRGVLSYNLPLLEPGQKIWDIGFDFVVPNGRNIPNAYIGWDDINSISINGSDYLVTTNQIYISAPISYLDKKTTPHRELIKISFISDYIHDKMAPQINDTEPFDVTVRVENPGEYDIYDLNIQMPININGLLYMNESKNIWIEHIAPGDYYVFTVYYNKTNARGYMISPPSYITSMDTSFVELYPSNPLCLGTFNITIHKSFSTLNGEIGDVITVYVNITNTGTLELANFTVDDSDSFDSLGFTLKEGFMIKEVGYLAPNETISFQYTLYIKHSGIFDMNPAKVEYYYKYRNVIYGNPEKFIAHERGWVLTSRIYVPIILAVIMTYKTVSYKKKVMAEEIEMERRERLLFGSDFLDVSWHKKNLVEYLEMESFKEGRGD